MSCFTKHWVYLRPAYYLGVIATCIGAQFIGGVALAARSAAGGVAGAEATPSRCGTSSRNPCPEVLLNVEVIDGDGSIANRVRSDGLGAYIHGVEKVIARLPAGGMLIFETAPTQPAIRSVVVDYSDPVAPSLPFVPVLNYVPNYRLKTNDYTTSWQQLGTPGFPSSMCSGLSIRYEDNANIYRSNLQSADAGSDPNVAYVTVTRVSTAPDEWIMETTPSGCNGKGDVALTQKAKVAASPKFSNVGYYHLPLKLRLTRKQ